jgi:hypothetical protein
MADTKAVQSPLQLFGLYLAWTETALAASLFATSSIEHWTKYLLIFVMAAGLLLYVLIAGFLLVYLVVKRPGFLFNPSDFDKSVQPMLFGSAAPKLEVVNPPEVEQLGGGQSN